MSNGCFDWLKTIFKPQRGYMQLKEYNIFEELEAYDLYLINELIHTREFKPGEIIFEAGYPLEVIYLINSGKIELQSAYGSSLSKELGKGEQLGIIDLFYNGQRNSTAIAKTIVIAHAISRSDLTQFIASRPRSGLKILSAISKNLCRFIFESANLDSNELD